MIDTVVLTLPIGQFTDIQDPCAPAWKLHGVSGSCRKHIKVQTAIQKQDGVYRPRLRMIERGNKVDIQIEFSVPKLILGNNVDEVQESNTPDIIRTLQARLFDFGLAVSPTSLYNAPVSVFHPSKNILLTKGYSSSGVIKELAKINLTQKMDINKDSFRNDGHSLQLYSNSHSLVIYDKVQDLKKPAKRAIDKDQTIKQRSLFDTLATAPKQTEILRLEVRITDKRKMNSILAKIGHKNNPTFLELLRGNACQNIVSLYWRELVANNHLFLFGIESNPQKTLQNLTSAYPNIKPKDAIYLIGLQQLCKDTDGIKSLRRHIQNHSTQRTWYRIAKDTKRLNIIQDPKQCHEWVREIESQIRSFQPLKIHDLLCKEL